MTKELIGLHLISENERLEQELSSQRTENFSRDLQTQDAAKLAHIKEMTNLEAQQRAKRDREYYEKRIAQLESQANPAGLDASYEIELERLQKQIQKISNDLQEKENEIENYEILLSKPMLEIAENNVQFKETYLQEQSLLAKWIISQHAFKELAMKYGKELGKTTEDILQETEIAKEKVTSGKSEINNNVDQNVINNLDYESGKKLREEEKKKQLEEFEREAKERRENALAEVLRRKKQKDAN